MFALSEYLNYGYITYYINIILNNNDVKCSYDSRCCQSKHYNDINKLISLFVMLYIVHMNNERVSVSVSTKIQVMNIIVKLV